MLHGNAISTKPDNRFQVTAQWSARDDQQDLAAQNNRFLFRLFGYCTAVGTVLGALIAMYLLQNEISGTSLFAASLSYASVGAISGILVAGFYDVIVRGSLDKLDGAE